MLSKIDKEALACACVIHGRLTNNPDIQNRVRKFLGDALFENCDSLRATIKDPHIGFERVLDLLFFEEEKPDTELKVWNSLLTFFPTKSLKSILLLYQPKAFFIYPPKPFFSVEHLRARTLLPGDPILARIKEMAAEKEVPESPSIKEK